MLFISQNILNKVPIQRSVDLCLKHIIRLTSADAYKILRATNLNYLVKFIIEWLKQETISMLYKIYNILHVYYTKKILITFTCTFILNNL